MLEVQKWLHLAMMLQDYTWKTEWDGHERLFGGCHPDEIPQGANILKVYTVPEVMAKDEDQPFASIPFENHKNWIMSYVEELHCDLTESEMEGFENVSFGPELGDHTDFFDAARTTSWIDGVEHNGASIGGYVQ